MEEPVFILRAQDIHAPQTIIDWARVVISNPNSTRTHFDKATAALTVANQMLEWQQLNPDKVKIPDLNYNMKAEGGEAKCFKMERFVPRPRQLRKAI